MDLGSGWPQHTGDLRDESEKETAVSKEIEKARGPNKSDEGADVGAPGRIPFERGARFLGFFFFPRKE